MKKNKITPEQALQFLEDFRKLKAGQDEPTTAISIRIPGNILRGYKLLAKIEERSYQTMMIDALREQLVTLSSKGPITKALRS